MQGDLRNFSRRDYENMIRAGILGEDEHLELVGGRIVVMSPEGPVHAGAIDLCAEILRRTFGPDHTVRVQHPLAIDKDDGDIQYSASGDDPDLILFHARRRQ